VYFTDPHGWHWEASCWLVARHGRDVDYADEQFFSTPTRCRPVRELAATGRLDHVVTTARRPTKGRVAARSLLAIPPHLGVGWSSSAWTGRSVALGAHWQPPCAPAPCGGSPLFVEVAVFIQAGLGVGMVSGQKIGPPKFHLFYGFVAIIASHPVSYRQQLKDRVYLLYGGGACSSMGLAIRAMLVAR